IVNQVVHRNIRLNGEGIRAKRVRPVSEERVIARKLPNVSYALANVSVVKIVDQIGAQGVRVTGNESFAVVGHNRGLRLSGEFRPLPGIVTNQSTADKDMLVLRQIEIELGNVGIEHARGRGGES